MKVLLFNTNLAARSVLSQLASGEKTVILTDQENIIKLIKLLNYDNIELLFFHSNYSLFNLPSLFKAKRRIIKLFKTHRIDEVVYYHQAYGGFYNWILVYAHSIDVKNSYHRVIKQVGGEKVNSLRSIINKWKYKLLYKTDVEIVKTGGSGLTPRLTDKFKERNGVNEKWATWDDKVIYLVSEEIAKSLQISTFDNKILLLTGSVIAAKQVDEMEYRIKMQELIESVGRDNIVCKCHPRFNDEIKAEMSLPHIPSYVPMELLMGKFKIVVGYGSSVLLDAAKKGLLSVSLVDYFQSTPPIRKTVLHDYFEGSKVVFINNIEELTTNINNLK